MEPKQMRLLSTEVFKKANNLNPNFMEYICASKTNARILPNNITVRHHNLATYSDKGLIILVPKIWNKHPKTVNLRHYKVV